MKKSISHTIEISLLGWVPGRFTPNHVYWDCLVTQMCNIMAIRPSSLSGAVYGPKDWVSYLSDVVTQQAPGWFTPNSVYLNRLGPHVCNVLVPCWLCSSPDGTKGRLPRFSDAMTQRTSGPWTLNQVHGDFRAPHICRFSVTSPSDPSKWPLGQNKGLSTLWTR